MKLMKFLVVALVAGGVFAPVASQAGEVDGKAVLCEWEKRFGQRAYTAEEKREEGHLHAFIFGYNPSAESKSPNEVYGLFISQTRELYAEETGSQYYPSLTQIHWGETDKYILSRKTLLLKHDIFGSAQCELIEIHKITSYFQPYIDYGNALDEKVREGNKI